MCRHQYFREEQELLPLPRFDTPPAPELLSPEELVVRESIGFNYCWGKLYSAALFKTLRFPENVSFGEDNLTTYKAVFAAEHIAFLPEALYFYFYSPTGITKMSWSPRSLECFLESWGNVWLRHLYLYHRHIVPPCICLVATSCTRHDVMAFL
jgi:hypothetical protein